MGWECDCENRELWTPMGELSDPKLERVRQREVKDLTDSIFRNVMAWVQVDEQAATLKWAQFFRELFWRVKVQRPGVLKLRSPDFDDIDVYIHSCRDYEGLVLKGGSIGRRDEPFAVVGPSPMFVFSAWDEELYAGFERHGSSCGDGRPFLGVVVERGTARTWELVRASMWRGITDGLAPGERLSLRPSRWSVEARDEWRIVCEEYEEHHGVGWDMFDDDDWDEDW